MLTSATVTIVDDDKSLRSALVELLLTVGFQVEGFETAEGFLGSQQASLTDCLVADIEMPGLNGFELADIVAAQREDVPIILMTGGDARLQPSRVARPICLLRKPFQSEKLLDCIEIALSRRTATEG